MDQVQNLSFSTRRTRQKAQDGAKGAAGRVCENDKTDRDFWSILRRGWKKLAALCIRIVRTGQQALNRFWRACLTRFALWSDPKLEPYRQNSVAKMKSSNVSKGSKTELFIPTTQAEFLELMRSLPKDVLSVRERAIIASAMSFSEHQVKEIMLPKTEIIYVDEDEVLGPLTLDRLYRSGFAHFPVTNKYKEIVGLIHTEALNSLEIRETGRAREILDKNICYLRDDYTLYQALAAFYRTGCYFFLVVDPFERIVGLLTYQMLMDFLLGETPEDDFDRDTDRVAVARRKK